MAFLNSMQRICAIFIIISVFAWPNVVNAQNVKMRTGIHENYSRLVVDWPSGAKADIKKQGAALNITFDKAANPDQSGMDVSKAQNIKNVKVKNTNPLVLSVTLPGDNRYRNFFAGNRFVLDIYNLPGQTQPIIAKKPEQKKQVQKPLKEVIKTAKVEPVEKEPLIEQANAEPPEETAEFVQLDNPGLQTANLIALSSSDSLGIAVFERAGKIYIVNDNPDLLMSPRVSGPDAKYLLPVETQTRDDAIIFKAQSMIGTYLRTRGGGLVWKVIISEQYNKQEPVKLERQNVIEGEIRSGKLLIPFKEPERVIEIPDPITGKNLVIVTTKTAQDFTGPRRSFPEFDMLASAAGLVILPRIDDLAVKITQSGIEISRPQGLSILPQKRIKQDQSGKKTQKVSQDSNQKKIFDFKNWQLGSLDAARENHNILLSNAANSSDSERDAALMSLAKMYLSHAMGAESLGFLTMIESYNPDINNTPEFLALRGVAHILDYKTEDGFNDLAIKDLEGLDDIKFWKAAALADIGDWQQAIALLPETSMALQNYPDLILNRLGLVSAEVALRAGNTELANEILALLLNNESSLNTPQKAALKYLRGESARQAGQIDETIKYWKPLIDGKDDLYRAKAGLALMRLKVDEEKIEPKEAINTLERLRYAWRGDALEARIGFWLGRTYFEAQEYLKGLNLMREAATVAAGTSLGNNITNEMTDLLTDLYLGDSLEQVSPLDAVALYEQFTEILPSDKTGDKIVERLADRLTQADLLGRASRLLSYQLNHRLDGIEAYNVAVKLSAIYLLDSNPAAALETLDIAQSQFDALPENIKTADKVQDMTLLRARALSRNGRPDQGIKMLEDLNDNRTTNRLRADIAWTAGYWDDAAAALGDVITDQNISLTRPLSDENTMLILQRAISLNLASDRIGLANMREKYSDVMAQTDQARIFEVITRPRRNAALADRDTLMGIVSEVDLFSDFLESYRAVSQPSN